LRRRQLFRDDEVVALTPKAFDLLQVLVTTPTASSRKTS
jgi:DNA-binding winged helix-turn-helix (wHTH) protein